MSADVDGPEHFELIVIGGGAAAHSAVQAFRESGGPGPVLMVSAETELPYNRPPLSKDYLRGGTESSTLGLAEPDFYSSNKIRTLLGTEVTGLALDRRRVSTDDGQEFSFRTAVLATGSAAADLPVPGGSGVFTLRSLDDAVALRERAQVATSAVVIGSGFIGCEAAASLAARGVRVTVVSTERAPQVDRLGPAAADLILRWLTGSRIEFRGEVEVSEIVAGTIVRLSDGTELSADLVLAAAGARPRVELAEAAGLTLRDGRIPVDSSMRTRADGLLAVGDIVTAEHEAAGRRLAVEHWGDAVAMGKVAGTVAAGGNATWSDPPGFWSEIGDHTLKYAAWGDGWDEMVPIEHPGGGLTVWYGSAGVTVGVLTHQADGDYETGSRLMVAQAPLPTSPRG